MFKDVLFKIFCFFSFNSEGFDSNPVAIFRPIKPYKVGDLEHIEACLGIYCSFKIVHLGIYYIEIAFYIPLNSFKFMVDLLQEDRVQVTGSPRVCQRCRLSQIGANRDVSWVGQADLSRRV